MKPRNRSLFILIAVIVAALSLSTISSDSFRSGSLTIISPLINLFSSSKTAFIHEQEIARLNLENQLLRSDLDALKSLVDQEKFLYGKLALEAYQESKSEHHEREIQHLFDLELQSLPAKIVFRPLNSWNSSLWISAGEQDNARLGRLAIAKNSPVVIGKAVVGVVDYVGNKQSRIRLITDASLNPYVRVKRGKHLLAKGELAGESTPALRGRTQKLRGVGFNYDFSDAEGPARDLRSGAPFKQDPAHPPLPLVQPQDLLITTGMDGIFPKGLEVGIVEKILPLKEGDYGYDLEAIPAAGNLNSLSLVFVLPPQYIEE
jgi:rod shape-determining protein MreC